MRAARVDANHAEVKAGIIEALPDCAICDLKGVGEGVPDLLVGWRGYNFLVEIKVPGKRLNERQTKWHGNWQGSAFTATSAAHAIAHMLRHVEGNKGR